MDLVGSKRCHNKINVLHIADKMKGITDIQGIKGLKFDIDQSSVRLNMRKYRGRYRPVFIRRMVTDNIE